MKKSKLQSEGYDSRVLSDPIFVMDHKKGGYVKLTEELMEDIEHGRMKL